MTRNELDTIEEAIEEAMARGRRAGKNAASWCFDGNTPEHTYRTIARQMEEGDPALDDHIQTPEWLSGQWAGESISELLGDLLPGRNDNEQQDDDDDVTEDAIMDAYCNAADEAFWAEIERTVNFHLSA